MKRKCSRIFTGDRCGQRASLSRKHFGDNAAFRSRQNRIFLHFIESLDLIRFFFARSDRVRIRRVGGLVGKDEQLSAHPYALVD